MFLLFAATEIDIGFEKTEYTTHDNSDYQVVCATVQSGSVGGRDIDIRYTVTDHGKHSTFEGVIS